jgi:hypothetical protein
MLLNIKNCTTLFIVLAFITSSTNAQNNIVKLEGTVKHDSSYLQDVNIVNKTSNLGTFSKKKWKVLYYSLFGRLYSIFVNCI